MPRGEWRCEAEVDGGSCCRRRLRPLAEATAAAAAAPATRRKNDCRFFRASLFSRGGSDAGARHPRLLSGQPLSSCPLTRRDSEGRTLQSSPRRSLQLLLLLVLRRRRRRKRAPPTPTPLFLFAPSRSITLPPPPLSLPPLLRPLRARSDGSIAFMRLSTAKTSRALLSLCGSSNSKRAESRRPRQKRRRKGTPRPRRPTSSGGAPPPRSAPPLCFPLRFRPSTTPRKQYR